MSRLSSSPSEEHCGYCLYARKAACLHTLQAIPNIPVLCFPVGGALFYLMFGRSHLNKRNTAKLKDAVESSKGIILPDNELLEMIGNKNAHLKREASYIINNSRSNIYAFTETEFLNPGSIFFEKLLIELKKAEKYIFLEYFIIGEGEMWQKILEIHGKRLQREFRIFLS